MIGASTLALRWQPRSLSSSSSFSSSDPHRGRRTAGTGGDCRLGLNVAPETEIGRSRTMYIGGGLVTLLLIILLLILIF